MEKISGIYSIVHIESGRPYVGSALDIYKRWSEHKSELTYNYHDNQRLQNFWNKYGEAAFEFKTLPCEDQKFCSKKCSSKYYGRLKTQEGTLKKSCLICNTEFATNRFQDKKYCSRNCYFIAKRLNRK